MQENVLNKQIEQTQKTITDNKEWQATYDKQANILLDNREVLKKFYKSIKDLEYLQFHITEVVTTPPTLFKITIRYYGANIATVELTKDEVHISTEPYNKSNKDNFECTTQLKGEEWNSKTTNEFLEYFRGDIKPKNSTGNSTALIEGLLLKEFSKTNSVEKLLTGIQPIKHEGLYFPIPTTIKNPKTKELENINLLARSKVRKITLLEVMNEEDTQDTVIQRATQYATFLLSLLHSENMGDKFYKLFGFHARKPVAHTIKVVVVTTKNSKCKEFEPYEVKLGADTLQYHLLEYQVSKDNTKITSIKTTLNEQG